MKIAMIGSGYVGLVTGACFADFGHDVCCVDKDRHKIERIKAGQLPIFEPGLEELLAKNLARGRLSFGADVAHAVEWAEIIFIAVGTPSRPSDGCADLSNVYAAAQEIGAAANDHKVIVTKSTVPVGTGDEIERVIKELGTNYQIEVASNPEFLREGCAIADFNGPDRIIIGADDDHAAAVMLELYRPLCANDVPVLVTSRRAAELIKYAANAFLATKITFINEISNLCEQVGVNVQHVSRGIGLDRRIGPSFLSAGPGYGGSCFPKDTLALAKLAEDFNAPLRIVETVSAVNEQRKRAMAKKVIAACGGSVRGKRIAVLGLTFKPDTDDMREAPSIALVTALQDAGAHIHAYDPKGMQQARSLFRRVEYADDAYSVVQRADAMVVLTEWSAFRSLDLSRIYTAMNVPIIIDLRNLFEPDKMDAAGFTYISIGRPHVRPKAWAEAAE